MLPGGGNAAVPGLGAVGEDDQPFVPEDGTDVVFVIAEVVVGGVFNADVAGFEFDEEQGQAVDKADQVGSFGLDVASDPELGDQ